MKILILNPHTDALRSPVLALGGKGISVLTAESAEEALQILQFHGRSVELAVVHREDVQGRGEQGLVFISKLRTDPVQSDLPVVITSQVWSESDFGSHQATPAGVHAYLRYPFTSGDLLKLIEGIFGVEALPVLPPKPSLTPVPPSISDSPMEEAQVLFEEAPSSIEIASDQEGSVEPAAMVVGNSGIEFPGLDIPAEDPPTASSGGGDDAIEFALEESPAFGSAEAAVPPSLPSTTMMGEPTVAPTVALSMEKEQDPEDARADREADDLIAREMPYFFGKSGEAPGSPEASPGTPGTPARTPGLDFALPVGDAVVPGGAAQTPDLETLKKYLLLREQDVAALSTQLKGARDQVSAVEDALRLERGRNIELSHTVEEQRRKLGDFDRDKNLALEAQAKEVSEIRFQLKAKADKVRLLEAQVREATEEMERLKDRVRSDIRKIRVREKELENRLEIMKKDSEALIGARENKIIELKRKLDLLEFNMDLLQDQYNREKENSARLKERLGRALQAVKIAGGLLNNGESLVGEALLDESERESAGKSRGEAS